MVTMATTGCFPGVHYVCALGILGLVVCMFHGHFHFCYTGAVDPALKSCFVNSGMKPGSTKHI